MKDRTPKHLMFIAEMTNALMGEFDEFHLDKANDEYMFHLHWFKHKQTLAVVLYIRDDDIIFDYCPTMRPEAVQAVEAIGKKYDCWMYDTVDMPEPCEPQETA